MKDVSFHTVAARDLARHLDKRLETVLQDFLDRCAEVGIDCDTATVKALTVLSHYVAAAAHGMELSEPEFLAVCRYQFRKGRS